MTIPNILTIFRICLIPIYLSFFYSGFKHNILLAGLVFIVAGVSDVLDGYIARKFNQVSDLGIILDPIADKLMSFTILITFTTSQIIPSWIIILMTIKEGLMLAGGASLYLFKGKQIVASNKYGKIATISFYLASLSVIFNLSSQISISLFSITVIVNILALMNYLFIYLKLNKEQLVD